METSSANLTEVVRSVQLLKIDGFSLTKTTTNSDYIRSRWNVDGYDWEIHLYPSSYIPIPYTETWVALKLLLISEARTDKVWASLSCRLVDPSGKRVSSEEKSASSAFSRPQTSSREVCLRRCDVFSRPQDSSCEVCLVRRCDVPSSGYLWSDSLTVECSINVLKQQKDVTFPAIKKYMPLSVPSSDMHQHFGKLLESQIGADVTFTVAGESFPAHKTVLAARSPVYTDMLHYIYTDTVPELHRHEDDSMVKAQNLLAAADRYGIDRLKLICESKLSSGISVDTVALTLALAEQHNCSYLKCKCVDFISRSRENLDAVLVTEGYKNLESSCPSVLTELLKATYGRKI